MYGRESPHLARHAAHDLVVVLHQPKYVGKARPHVAPHVALPFGNQDLRSHDTRVADPNTTSHHAHDARIADFTRKGAQVGAGVSPMHRSISWHSNSALLSAAPGHTGFEAAAEILVQVAVADIN